ncbi:MAG: rubrerythrin family protein [Clostridia bacterium]|nr:rubrerythrin family protein [Clostridia bacterium]
MNLQESETKRNLLRAFAGESQARNRYTFAASLAKKQNLTALSDLFLFTAGQEKEHAEIFYGHLQPLRGGSILIDAAYPIDDDTTVASLLHASHKNEMEEYGDIYPAFAKKAEEEGFTAIAASFRMIAEIERTHGERFARYAAFADGSQLFASESECVWMCLNCGHVHTGKGAPAICPVCKHEQGYFIRLADAPFTSLY